MNIINIMRSTFFKNAFASASLVLAVGHAPIALAHTKLGSLGSGAGATDLYTVTCSTNADGAAFQLLTQVQDNTAGSSLVQVQTRKGSIATNSTDPSAGDRESAYSLLVKNIGGNGAYDVLVNKTASGKNSYALDYHCVTSAGLHSALAIILKQNQ